MTKKIKETITNPLYDDLSILTPLKQNYGQTDFTDPQTGNDIIASPFSACHIKSVLDTDFAVALKRELLDMPFVERSNDLYFFYQSDDLKKSPIGSHVHKFREVALCKVREMVQEISGIVLEENLVMDLAGQRYPPQGYLLCHDDRLDGRRIAFILYLVDEDWSEELDGGSLVLFDSVPSVPVSSIVPCFNSVAFFEVTPTSYHQVAETLRRDRVSITGWFHGPNPGYSKLPAPERIISNPLALEKFIHADYLRADNMKSVRNLFENESSVQLGRFLLPGFFDSLVHELGSSDFTAVGPANVCSFGLLERPQSACLSLVALWNSHPFLAWLEQVTTFQGDIHKTQITRFSTNSYTLLHDDCPEPLGLDALFFITPNWKSEYGGTVHYVCQKETLLSILPVDNTLCLAFRDDGVYRFVSYVNSLAGDCFYMVDGLYSIKK